MQANFVKIMTARKSSKRPSKEAASNLTDFCKPCPNDKKRKKAANTSRQPTQPVVPAPRSNDPIVQVINGELVLQQQHETANHDDERSLTVVVEEQAATTGIVVAGYSDFTVKRTGSSGNRWTAAETDVFFTALRQVGLDFGTMEAYFEGRRTRRQLKRKYYSELKQHPELVEMVLQPAARVKIDLEVFELTEETLKDNIAEEDEKKREEEAKAMAADIVASQEVGDTVRDGDKEENATADDPKSSTEAIVPVEPVIDEFTDPTLENPIMHDDEDDDMHEEFMGTEGIALHEETETQEEAEEKLTLSLVHVDKPKKVKAKPRFKSRKTKKPN